jgi:hypothetical protein
MADVKFDSEPTNADHMFVLDLAVGPFVTDFHLERPQITTQMPTANTNIPRLSEWR